jgi:hypothetical protein
LITTPAIGAAARCNLRANRRRRGGWSAPMLVAPVHTETTVPAQSLPQSRASHTLRLRAVLLFGCAAMVVAGGWYGQPDALLQADPQLAQMLRGMALIKAAMVLAAISLLAWRFGHPIGRRQAVVYLAGVWLAAAGSMLIWQLTHIPAAAVMFHLGEFAFLLMAWRDWQHVPQSD